MSNLPDPGQALTTDCLAYLGLHENPFSEHARLAFIYSDSTLEMPINVLLDYLDHRNSTLILRGEAGIGKTTQLRLLLQRGHRRFGFCSVRARQGLDLMAINELIHVQWRRHDAAPADAHQAVLEDHLTDYIEAGHRPVLVIDDAHRLEEKTLDALLRLKHAVGLRASQPLGLVLAAEPGIDIALATIERSNPASTQLHSIKLQPLKAPQTSAYITHRLASAGFRLDPVLDESALHEIHRASKGLPRYINALANRRLNRLCSQTLDPAPTTDFRRVGVIILASVLAIAVLVGLFSWLAA